MGVTVRAVRPGDEIGLQANCKTASSLDQVRQQVLWTTREAGFPRLSHFVADDDGQVIGTVMLMVKEAHPDTDGAGGYTTCLGRPWVEPSVGQLSDWVVCGRYWRRGIGTLLAERVVSEARSWGMVRLETSSFSRVAQSAFRKMGFTQYGSLPALPGAEDGRPEALFLLDL